MEKNTEDGTKMSFHTNAIKMHILKTNTTDVCIYIYKYMCTHAHVHTHTQMFYKFPRFNKKQNSRHQDKPGSFDSNFLFNKESFVSC